MVACSTNHDESSSGNRFSLSTLQQRIAHYLNNNNSQCYPKPQLAVVIAGGGGSFLSTLAATPGASSILAEGTVTYSRESFLDYIAATHYLEPPDQYASSDAANLLSRAACARTMRLNMLQPEPPSSRHWIGLSCTSVLRSIDQRPKGGSRAFLSVCTANEERTMNVSAKLASDTERTRFDEDVVLGHFLLSMLEFASGWRDVFSLDGVVWDETNSSLGKAQGTTAVGDRLEVETNISRDGMLDSLVRAASRILAGTDDVVMLVPSSSERVSFEVLSSACLPPNSLIFPGSFNPPHRGHIALAKASAAAMQSCNFIFFEMSVTNPDKPSLEVDDVASRLQHFLSFRNDELQDTRWGILLTDASLFKRKAEILHARVPKTQKEHNGLTFCIGTDTFVRIIDPKYYGNSEEAMLAAVRNMNCKFVVGGRLDQKRKNGEFISGQQELEALPEDVQHMFTILADFRVDLSSSEIRAGNQKAR